MNGFILLLLLVGVIYVAFTYFKGPRNPESYRDEFRTRSLSGQDPWNGGPGPELPGNDETEMDSDGEDPEVIGFDSDELEEIQASEPEGIPPAEPGANASAQDGRADIHGTQVSASDAQDLMPETNYFVTDTHASTPDKQISASEPHTSAPETYPSEQETHTSAPETPGIAETPGVVIDSEVRIDAKMPSDTNR